MEDLVPVPKINFVPCVRWVKRGVARENPYKVELTEEELEAVINQTKNEIDEVRESNENVKGNDEDEHNSTEDEYDFAHYDNDDNARLNFGDIVVTASTSKDPYITIDNDDDSEKDDDIIRVEDNLILVGHVEGDSTVLEVYVHNEEEGSLYVHHDVLLPSFPLCIEWLGIEPKSEGAPGNLCAIGTMSPVIEVWDLDMVDCIEATCKLGRKRNKKKRIKSLGHKDAVLDLSWNTILPHILASGSVDQTVLLWDLDNGLPASKFISFNEKVQSLKWHPFENQTLLTGCCDGGARVFDCRTEESFKLWKVDGEVERVLWNHFSPYHFIASTSTGKIYYIDCRNDTPVWDVNAHSKEVTGLSMSAQCPGLLTTASTDGQVKIWDVMRAPGTNSPVLVDEKDIGLGAVHCLEGNPDSPFIFCAGGDNRDNNLKVWDLRHKSIAVEQHFSSRQLLCSVSVKSEADEQPSEPESREQPSSSQQQRSVTVNLETDEVPMDTTGEATEALQSLSLGQERHKNIRKIPLLKKNIKASRYKY